MICDPCRDEQFRWMDTKPSELITPGIRIGNNATFDMSSAGVVGNSRSRYDKWRELVNRQCNLIRESCGRGEHGVQHD